MLRSYTLRALALTLGCLISLPAASDSILFSTAQPGAVPGTSFADNDVVLFNTVSGMGEILFTDDVINDGGLSDLNALYADGSGDIIFSVTSGTAVFPFDDDKMVRYSPATDSLSLFYDFAGVITGPGDIDINGFHIMPNGNFLLANRNDFTLDSQNFNNGDIVMFDPLDGTASLIFSEAMFGGTDAFVSAVSMRANGNIILAAFNEDTGGALTLGGLTFGRGDLVEFDPLSGTASLLVSVSIFGGATEDFDAVHLVPVPAAVWLFLSALGLLARRRAGVGGVGQR